MLCSVKSENEKIQFITKYLKMQRNELWTHELDIIKWIQIKLIKLYYWKI